MYKHYCLLIFTGTAYLNRSKKPSRIVFVDEDVPGGGAAYMFNKVMEEQGGYRWLDTAPRTITAKDHRPAYASDGDYFSKPNAEDNSGCNKRHDGGMISRECVSSQKSVVSSR